MNERIEHYLYQAGLTAQGCWDELDDYTKQGIEKFAHLVAAAEREACAEVCDEKERANLYGVKECAALIRARGDK